MSVHAAPGAEAIGLGLALVREVISAGEWLIGNAVWIGLVAAAVAIAAEAVRSKLAEAASIKRVRFELAASRRFEPTAEQIWRYAAQLVRASGSGPWWAPARAKGVRVRWRADGSVPLAMAVEGPASARHLLASSPYGRQVKVALSRPRADKHRDYTVRAEFVIHGSPAAGLREVPLEPDPLQPLVDAVADLRAERGDLAEVCLDLQRIPMWRLRLRRHRLLSEARDKARRTARRESRWAWQDAADLEDSWRYQLMNAVSADGAGRAGASRRFALPARPRPVDRDKTLGKLADSSGLVRVQLLVRCCSNTPGQAEARLRHIEAAMDVFGARSRIVMAGRRIGPWRYGANSWPRRKNFDQRWASAQVAPLQQNWLRVDELAGLLKPPTVHCQLPLMAGDLPEYTVGKAGLIPHGWHTGADGVPRLLATREAETLFSTTVGKAGHGKTEKALVQAIALAHGGHGLLYVDPHGDSWAKAAPYLVRPKIMARLWRIDLTRSDDQARLGCWNPLGVDRGQKPHEVTRATVDAFAAVLGWNDLTAPRAMTIFTKAVQALVTINATAVAAGHSEAQATVFQIRTLLTNRHWRATVLDRLAQVDQDAVAWWRTSFEQLPADALPTVLNPLDRLAADPVARAFLGSPTGAYDIRQAMDAGRVVWICPSANGPTDRLLVALLIQDLLRAGLSRREVPEEQRRSFHAFIDELISIDGAASSTLAEITEQLRKFRVRLHVMTQLLQRVSESTRASLLQNSSVLSTTAGSWDAVRIVAAEWGGAMDPAEIAELPRFVFAASFTVAGKRIGPVLLNSPTVEDTFGKPRRSNRVTALHRAADTALDAKPLPELTAIASTHDITVRAFLSGPAGPDDPGPHGPGPDRGPDGSSDGPRPGPTDLTQYRHHQVI